MNSLGFKLTVNPSEVVCLSVFNRKKISFLINIPPNFCLTTVKLPPKVV